MKLDIFPSTQTSLPESLEKIDLLNSIIVEDDYGAPILVGESARDFEPESVKRRGGQPRQTPWKNLLRACVARHFGAGKHRTDIAFSTAMSQVDFFRGSEAKGKKEITVENYEIIKKVLSNIRFKKSLNEDWQVANVTLEEVPLVHFECASVILGIPEKFRSYLLWQLGYGDWQQILMLDGRPIPTSMSLIDGISGAHEIFKQTNKLSHGQAAKAWETKLLPEKDSYNGITYDATEQIKRAISAYFSSKIGKQLNLIDQYRDRISHVILSGGSSKDEHVVEILRHELEAEGLKLITIQQIMEKNDLPIKDPSFATIAGISKNATLSIDIGNSYVKSGLRV